MLGEHLRKRRYELGLLQKDVARQMGVNQWTLIGWEQDRTVPSVRMLPKIIAFLGYDPFPQPATLGERIIAKRRALGIARKSLARELQVDEGSLRKWEHDAATLTDRSRTVVEKFLTSHPSF